MQKIRYFSAFSGIGGFELGMQQTQNKLCPANKKQRMQGVGSTQGQFGGCSNFCSNRFTCIGFSEIDTYATTIYQRHFPTHQNYGDITTIDEKNMPDFDLLVGGFPCQAFSIAGKRGGFNDTRGTMFFEIARIIREKQPRLLLCVFRVILPPIPTTFCH